MRFLKNRRARKAKEVQDTKQMLIDAQKERILALEEQRDILKDQLEKFKKYEQ